MFKITASDIPKLQIAQVEVEHRMEDTGETPLLLAHLRILHAAMRNLQLFPDEGNPLTSAAVDLADAIMGEADAL